MVFTDHLGAATMQTFGTGSAVTSVDRAATFNSITSSGIALSDYTEGKLFIGANADSLLGYDPFGGANGSDPLAGFDQLLVKCNVANQADLNIQALALDNLQVMLTNRPPAPAIYGSDLNVNPTNHVPALTVYGTIAGCQYRLVYTETLTAPVWTPVSLPLPEGWQPGGGTLTFTDPGTAGKPHRFYRLQVR